MARRLSSQSREKYACPPKAMPRPVDLLPYPEIMSRVRAEWVRRMEEAAKGKRIK